jgi:hypothetical protein
VNTDSLQYFSFINRKPVSFYSQQRDSLTRFSGPFFGMDGYTYAVGGTQLVFKKFQRLLGFYISIEH